MKPRTIHLACVALLALAGCNSSTQMDVKELGASADGVTSSTVIIQHAIDQCSAAGGGVVRIPAGRYVVGTLQIKSDVTLKLDDGATLLGSLDRADYRSIDTFTDATVRKRGEAMIVAVDAKNIAIEGSGVIDGQGARLVTAQKSSGDIQIKPFLMRLVGCENVSIKGIQLHNSAAWTLHISRCKQVSVDHIAIDSRALANNDGIDIDSSQGVRISDCDINTGDDAICIKTTSPQPCGDISVSGCTLQSRCSTLKVGTETVGDIANIKVDHCRIKKAGLGGIKLFSVDGAHLENVEITDIQMDQARVPVMVRLGGRLKTFRAGDVPRAVGVVKNISIKNVTATNASGVGILISGIPGHPVEGIDLENIRIELPGGVGETAAAVVPEKESAYPEVYVFGNSLPAYGVYARHVQGLRITGLNLILSKSDVRAACECEDVAGKNFANWNVPIPQ